MEEEENDEIYGIRFVEEPNIHGLVRARLRSMGFNFCDDDFLDHGMDTVSHDWFDEGTCLKFKGISASSTDHETQSINETEQENGERFWSSAGSKEMTATEELLFELEAPCNKIHGIGLRIFRATYQYGMPIYPPQIVSVCVGNHPKNLMRAWPLLAPKPSTDLQVLELPQDTPPAKFVKLELVGKQQMQYEDKMYYTAVRQVIIRGKVLSPMGIKAHLDQRSLPSSTKMSHTSA